MTEPRGLVYLELGIYKSAIRDFSKCISMNPLLPKGYYYRGFAELQLGEYDAALGDINYSLSLDKKNSEGYYYLGLVYWEQDLTRLACLQWDRAIEYGYREENLELYSKCK